MNNQEHALTLREADTLARRGDLSAAANLIEKLLVAVPDHSQALTMLGRIYRANNQSEKAVSILRKLCLVDGQDFWSWFELGEAFEANSDLVGAVNAFLKAWSLNKGNARFALYAGYALWQAGRNEEALQVWSIGSDMDPLVRIAHLRPDADQTTRIKSETADKELRRFFTQMYQSGLARYENPERLLSAMWPQTHIGNVEYKRENQKPYMFYAPDLPETPVFETSEIPWAQTLKNATPKIIQELETYLENTHDYGRPYLAHMSDGEESWEHLRGSEDWNALHLYKDAEKQSCASSFPETLTTLEDAPLVEMFGTPMEVFFSVLKPNTHIPPHFGLSNSRLTAHLPLIIPRDCKIRVADQTHHWRRGELFLFDDSFDHEARNDSDEVRVVLIFETWRPDLSADEVRALQHSMEVRSQWLQSRKIPVIENI